MLDLACKPSTYLSKFVADQKTPAITTPIPTSPIPTSLPKRVQKSEGSQNAARKMQSTRALNIAAASADDGSGYDYFSLPALTVDFVQVHFAFTFLFANISFRLK